MPYREAIRKPVETVLSGPAASANGACFLTGKRDMLVLDMGSTTTDMALVDDGHVVVSEEGARVGSTRTSVESARILTLCVGCDSRIGFDRDGAVTAGPEKIVPISLLASRQPEVASGIAALADQPPANWRATDVEYWFMLRDAEADDLNGDEARVVDALQQGPRSLTEIVEACGVYHHNQLRVEGLFRTGVLGAAGLTPSDLLHVNGTMDLWHEAAADQAVRVICRTTGRNRRVFVEGTLELIVRMIVENAMIFLACQEMRDAEMPVRIDGKWGRWFFDQMIDGTNRFVAVNLDSRYPLVGVGAPARFFIGRAAQILSTPFSAPPHYEVANAVGAVSGLVMEVREAIAFEREVDGTRSAVVKIGGETRGFPDWEAACEFAEEESYRQAWQAASDAGAVDPHVEIHRRQEGGLHRYLARAMGNPRLSGERTDDETSDETAGDILCRSLVS
jgi:hypothetical protein